MPVLLRTNDYNGLLEDAARIMLLPELIESKRANYIDIALILRCSN